MKTRLRCIPVGYLDIEGDVCLVGSRVDQDQVTMVAFDQDRLFVFVHERDHTAERCVAEQAFDLDSGRGCRVVVVVLAGV